MNISSHDTVNNLSSKIKFSEAKVKRGTTELIQRMKGEFGYFQASEQSKAPHD